MDRRCMRGFTLVELMATVAILAVLVLVTIPPVMRAVQRREGANAAQAIVDLLDFTKVQAAQRNRAYQVSWALDPTGNGGGINGVIQVFEGDSSACTTFSSTPARVLDLSMYQTVHLQAVQPADLTSVCVKPDGRVLTMSGTPVPAATGDTTYGAGDLHFVLYRYLAPGKEEAPRHRVIVPFNGPARITSEG